VVYEVACTVWFCEASVVYEVACTVWFCEASVVYEVACTVWFTFVMSTRCHESILTLYQTVTVQANFSYRVG